ncbi:MAG: DUF4179 domain-containing protein [Clostridia bacterium]|nr:DUF4179 domain-containing protein [Clostridia bacterium]
MKEQDLRKALNDYAAGCSLPMAKRRQILAQMEGEEPVKKKLTVSFALVMAIMLATLSAAFALVQSHIGERLFGVQEVPHEVLESIVTPQTTTQTELGSLTLDEVLYDGSALHTSFTVANPTQETLMYTLEGIRLNGKPVTYNHNWMEGAGSTALLLGGSVAGTQLPASYSLYNMAEEVVNFDENQTYLGTAPLPEGKNTLTIEMAVWEPLNAPELVDYNQWEGVDVTETKDHLTVDARGRSDLAMFKPRESHRDYNASQSGAEIYVEIYKALGWAQLTDTIKVEVELDLSKESLSRVAPQELELEKDGLKLVMDAFEMTQAGGEIDGWLYGEYNGVKQFMAKGLCLTDAAGETFYNAGMWWDDQPEDAQGVHFTMKLGAFAGELPEKVYLAPVIGNNQADMGRAFEINFK